MHHPKDPVPDDILLTSDLVLINTHLPKFAVTARKANGEAYPLSTIYSNLHTSCLL